MYAISTCGRIKAYAKTWRSGRNGSQIKTRKECIMKQHVEGSGYLKIKLTNNGVSKHFKVHTLVAKTFLDKRDGKVVVNHKDGNKQNNHVDNLEYVTYSENIQHAIKNGLVNISGEDCHLSKLTNGDVLYIRKYYKKPFSAVQLAKKFNVHKTTIFGIVARKTWKNV